MAHFHYIEMVAKAAHVPMGDVDEVSAEAVYQAYHGILPDEDLEEVLCDDAENSRYYRAAGQYYICEPDYDEPLPLERAWRRRHGR